MSDRVSGRREVGPLLTIAIPTYNRAEYLTIGLAHLRAECRGVAPGRLEVIVSDNCSPDTTEGVVRAAIADGLDIRYVRNSENVGWGPNFARCFDLATGKYVLLLGDDDLLADGVLAGLLDRLANRDYGVVCLRPFGFDIDPRAEHPGRFGEDENFSESNRFLAAIGHNMTMISACVVNKAMLKDVDSFQFSGGNLAHLPLVLRAALRAPQNLYVRQYSVACKRNNSSAYQFGDVFVTEWMRTLDAHIPFGLRPKTIAAIESRLVLFYFPHYVLDLQLQRAPDLKTTQRHFVERFGGRWAFELWLSPIGWLPRPLAIVWGVITTGVGRVAGGELRRGIALVRNRLSRSTRTWLGMRRDGSSSAGVPG